MYGNYLFYIFVLVIVITAIIWFWILYNKDRVKPEEREEILYEYVEEENIPEIMPFINNTKEEIMINTEKKID